MTQTIDAVFQSAYDAEVKRAYGDESLLERTVRTKTGIVGQEVYFRKAGKGMASRLIKDADVTAMNVDFSQVKCPMESWGAYDYADDLDQTNINFSEAKELGGIAGTALGLRKDQIKIDAMKNKVSQEVGSKTQKLSVEALRNAAKILNKHGVPKQDRFFIHNAQQLDDLLGSTQITSSEYNTVKALVNGEINTFMGFEFICIAERKEGGLPKNTENTATMAFAYHKSAIGFASSKEVNSSIDWIPEKQAWLVGGKFRAGAVVIDTEGLVGVWSVDNAA